MNSPIIKCWGVCCLGDDWEELIHALTRGQAISRSEKYFDCGDWTQMRARRVPEMDGLRINQENIEAAGLLYVEL